MKTLLVDDERLARNELRRLLAAHPQLEIIGEAHDATSAERALADHAPELVFLDVQMPGRDGFALLEALEVVPLVVFTTAYDRYALRAFEVSAVDYLVKPIAAARLAAAVARVLERVAAPAPAQAPRQIFVRDGERCWLVDLVDIALLQSEGNYTRLFFAGNQAVVPRSLQYLEERLAGHGFLRASRQHLLNLAWIVALEPWVNGGLRVRLRDGREVTMSRRQALKLQERMQL